MTGSIWRSSACWFIIIPAIISAPSIVMRFHPLCSLLPWYHAFNHLSTSAWYLLLSIKQGFHVLALFDIINDITWNHCCQIGVSRILHSLFAVWHDGLISCGMNRFQSCHLHAMIAHYRNHCKSGVSPCFPMFLTGCVHVSMSTITIIPHGRDSWKHNMVCSQYFHISVMEWIISHVFPDWFAILFRLWFHLHVPLLLMSASSKPSALNIGSPEAVILAGFSLSCDSIAFTAGSTGFRDMTGIGRLAFGIVFITCDVIAFMLALQFVIVSFIAGWFVAFILLEHDGNRRLWFNDRGSPEWCLLLMIVFMLTSFSL